MVEAEDVYREYLAKGQLSGIVKEFLNFLKTPWQEHDKVKEKAKKAAEIYSKIFPRGKPPTTPEEVIRRRRIVAAYLGRLRRRGHPRLKEVEELYKEYSKIVDYLIQYRDFWRRCQLFVPDLEAILSSLRSAKVETRRIPRAELYFFAIRLAYGIFSTVVHHILPDYPDLVDIYTWLTQLFGLATLWIKFRYVETVATRDRYWLFRALEIHFETWTHAELLFDVITDKTAMELIKDILKETKNDWLLHFSEFKEFKYMSKELIEFMSGVYPTLVDFSFVLYDHNYGFTRVKTKGPTKLPAEWQRFDVKTLKMEYILRTGDIVWYEVRGRRGPSPYAYELEEVKQPVEMYKVAKIDSIPAEDYWKTHLIEYSLKKELGIS